MAIFSLGAAHQLFGKSGVYDRIAVKAVPGVSVTQLRDRIAAALPPGDQAVTAASAAASAAQQINSQLGILRDFFLGFAGIALFVGAFVIWKTFSIMVGQRTRELALTRALGASAGQVFRSVLAEAVIVAAVASLAGAGLGLLLAKGLALLLSSFGLSLPISGLVLPGAELAVAVGTGIAMTVVASLAPAFRVTRVRSVQALRESVAEPSRLSPAQLAGGIALTVAGVASLLAGTSGGGIALTAGRRGPLLHRRHHARAAHRPPAGHARRRAARPATRPDRRARPRQHDSQPEADQRHGRGADDRPGRDHRHVGPGELRPGDDRRADKRSQPDPVLRAVEQRGRGPQPWAGRRDRPAARRQGVTEVRKPTRP